MRDEEPGGEPEQTTGQEGILRCASCGHPITRRSERIEVDGAHESVRVNLAGVLFRVGCFRVAPGCRVLGERTTHWSWFAGYAWQVAVCARCGEHLGWRYSRAESRFHGLLLDHLT